MTEPIPEPTQGSEPVVPEPTPAPMVANEPEPIKKKIEMTQEELDAKMAERAARAERAAEKKLAKQIEDMQKQIKTFEDQGLSDVEKLKRDYEKSSGKIKDLELSLTGAKLENAKLKSLIKAGAIPEQLDGLLKRVAGATEEEIEADVEELKALGWIGKPIEVAPAPTPQPKNSAQGSGHPPVGDKGTRTYTRTQLKDADFYNANREDIMKALGEGRIK